MPAPRPCLIRGCTSYATVSRCPKHEAEHESARRKNGWGTGRRSDPPGWKARRARVLARDRRTCRLCKRHEAALKPGEQMEVDHVDGNARNDELENLQTLCSTCHKKKTRSSR